MTQAPTTTAARPWAGCCRSDSLTPDEDDYAGVGADEMCRDCPYLSKATGAA